MDDYAFLTALKAVELPQPLLDEVNRRLFDLDCVRFGRRRSLQATGIVTNAHSMQTLIDAVRAANAALDAGQPPPWLHVPRTDGAVRESHRRLVKAIDDVDCGLADAVRTRRDPGPGLEVRRAPGGGAMVRFTPGEVLVVA